jgi:hypothetical protein
VQKVLAERVSYYYKDGKSLKNVLGSWAVAIQRSRILQKGTRADIAKLPPVTNRNKSRGNTQQLKRKGRPSVSPKHPHRQIKRLRKLGRVTTGASLSFHRGTSSNPVQNSNLTERQRQRQRQNDEVLRKNLQVHNSRRRQFTSTFINNAARRRAKVQERAEIEANLQRSREIKARQKDDEAQDAVTECAAGRFCQMKSTPVIGTHKCKLCGVKMHGALCAKAYVEGGAMSCYKCGVPPREVMGDDDWQTNQDKAEVYLGGAEIV